MPYKPFVDYVLRIGNWFIIKATPFTIPLLVTFIFDNLQSDFMMIL